MLNVYFDPPIVIKCLDCGQYNRFNPAVRMATYTCKNCPKILHSNFIPKSPANQNQAAPVNENLKKLRPKLGILPQISPSPQSEKRNRDDITTPQGAQLRNNIIKIRIGMDDDVYVTFDEAKKIHDQIVLGLGILNKAGEVWLFSRERGEFDA